MGSGQVPPCERLPHGLRFQKLPLWEAAEAILPCTSMSMLVATASSPRQVASKLPMLLGSLAFVSMPRHQQQHSGFTARLRVAPSLALLTILADMQVEECGLKLAHQFPWAASAYVAVGLALRRRELTYPDMPSSAPKRKQIMKVRLCVAATARRSDRRD